MFLKKAELESSSDEADNADKVRPVRIPAPAGGGAEGVQRSSQYEERLSRARNSKTMAFRKTTNAGMVMANSFDKPSRPGTASARDAPLAIEQEIEEMELEDSKQSEEARRKAKAALLVKAKQQKQEFHFAEDSPPPRVTMMAAAAAAEASSDEEEADETEAARPQRGSTASMASTRSQDEDEDEDEEDEAVTPAGLASHPAGNPALPYIPAVIDTSDMRTFLMTPGPQGAMVQCYIQRRKTGMARLFPTYEIYLKEGDKFLMAARKRKKNKSSNYLVSLDKDDLSRNSGNFFGKLRSNFIGTEFTLYDKGANPDKADESGLVLTRQELGCILYKQNVLGSRGPRRMKVMVPDVSAEGERRVLRPESADQSMLERYKAAQNDEDVQILKNKPPKWNEQVGAYVLNFNGRVTRASVKNFQLYNPSRDPEAVIMQFGRVGKDAFTMDYQHPLCALQAFGIALSSFDYKIACE